MALITLFCLPLCLDLLSSHFFIGALLSSLLTSLTSLFPLSCPGLFSHLSPLTCIPAPREPCAFVCPAWPAAIPKGGHSPHLQAQMPLYLASHLRLLLSDVLLLPMKQISEVVCFLQAFVPELCFADLTTVSVFIYKTLALGVYEIGSFLCSIS